MSTEVHIIKIGFKHSNFLFVYKDFLSEETAIKYSQQMKYDKLFFNVYIEKK